MVCHIPAFSPDPAEGSRVGPDQVCGERRGLSLPEDLHPVARAGQIAGPEADHPDPGCTVRRLAPLRAGGLTCVIVVREIRGGGERQQIVRKER